MPELNSWHHKCSPMPFAATYHSWRLRMWARQILGATINMAFAKHLYGGIQDLNSSSHLVPSLAFLYPLAIGHLSHLDIHSSILPRRGGA